MCFESIREFWNNLIERLIQGIRNLISWIAQRFRCGSEDADNVSILSDVVSKASEETQLVDATVEEKKSKSSSDTSVERIGLATQSLVDICSSVDPNNGDKKIGRKRGKTKYTKQNLLGLNLKSYSDPLISRDDETRDHKKQKRQGDNKRGAVVGPSCTEEYRDKTPDKSSELASGSSQKILDDKEALRNPSTSHTRESNQKEDLAGQTTSASATNTNENLESRGTQVDLDKIESITHQAAEAKPEIQRKATPEFWKRTFSYLREPSESSESYSSPIVIVEKPEIHREDHTDSENSNVLKEEINVDNEPKEVNVREQSKSFEQESVHQEVEEKPTGDSRTSIGEEVSTTREQSSITSVVSDKKEQRGSKSNDFVTNEQISALAEVSNTAPVEGEVCIKEDYFDENNKSVTGEKTSVATEISVPEIRIPRAGEEDITKELQPRGDKSVTEKQTPIKCLEPKSRETVIGENTTKISGETHSKEKHLDSSTGAEICFDPLSQVTTRVSLVGQPERNIDPYLSDTWTRPTWVEKSVVPVSRVTLDPISSRNLVEHQDPPALPPPPPLIPRRELRRQDSQNTQLDVPSEILDSDPVAEDISGVESLPYEGPFNAQGTSQSSDVQQDQTASDVQNTSSDIQDIQTEPTSSDIISLNYSTSGEADENLPAQVIVSEEIQEEERYVQANPEVENEANVLFHFEYSKKNYYDVQQLIDLTKQFLERERQGRELNSVDNSTENEICSEGTNSTETLCLNNSGSSTGSVTTMKAEINTQVRVLTLNEHVFQDSVLYRLGKHWIVEFRLGPTLFGRKISIYCNYPSESNGRLKFDRSNYTLLDWKSDEGCENSDDTALYVRISCEIAGNFHYYFTDHDSSLRIGSGYFIVDPTIHYGQGEILPLDCIQCQTVISKQLGPFSTWENKLLVTKESGYNMVHFTPVQELGDSNSAYSLKDQLKLNSSFARDTGEVPTWEELKSFIKKLSSDWKLTSICDIVLNHTANESPWIKEHTDATYNCSNCMYMRPAYLLDATLNQFSMDIRNGLYDTKGIPVIVDSEEHLNAMSYYLLEHVLKELKLEELYTCDVNKCISQFLDVARQNPPLEQAVVDVQLELVQDPEYRRLASTVDLNLALKIYNIYRPGCFDEDTRLRKSCEELKTKLDSLNQAVENEIRGHLNAAVGNVVEGVRYWRVSKDGPRWKEITLHNPLFPRYFTDHGNPTSMKEYEDIMFSENSKFLMAHNGWIMNGDPLVNFAGPESNVYIRRELIAWGDSVKLRFGEKPEDSAYLWDHMKKYVVLTASIFDGVRLDNCHSTPIHVAQYLLDCAREVKPDLYVVAELFTNSDEKDNIFVNSLGISSLIREAMNSTNSHEQGRLVHRFGGIPVGSFYQPKIRPLVPSIAHALFLDQTHDNPSPIEKSSVFNLLTTSALVNMACCGTGSNRGYDELVPHQISVVDETREYTEWTTASENIGNTKFVSPASGIIAAKKVLNDLHFQLGSNGFNQVYVDQMDPDIVAVTRHCPITHQSYVLVAYTAFKHPYEDEHKWQRNIKPLRVEGVLDQIVLEATLDHIESRKGGSKYARSSDFKRNDLYIDGYSEYKVNMKQNIQLFESDVFEEIASGNPNEIALSFKNFKPGSIVIVKVSLSKATTKIIQDFRGLMSELSSNNEIELKKIIKKLTLSDLNRVLYRCDQEERDEGKGFDTYSIPNFGNTVYSGLQGFISLLSKIRPSNDLGHPMCDNLRQGDWMIDYISQRLILDEGTKDLGEWIKKHTNGLRTLPKYLKPAYFDMLFSQLYILLLEHAYDLMSRFVNEGSIFVKSLALGSLQFAAYIKSANLPKLSPDLSPPKPPMRVDENGQQTQACVSLSAGLPHFSVGYMRNWGRDTFIALRGLFILTGRHQEARYHILGYAACLRHGLIPNLLDGGRKPRFNCRDAIWWWLYCIKCYTEEVPNGVKILNDKVSRIFPTDESPNHEPGETDQTLQDVIQEALNRHFQGVTFRERNAGRDIDEHMRDNGFNNQIGVHPETGFVFGGNLDNCGTWMDKMGSSDKAGNRGQPATPRDGSACEIVGLCKCAVSWLASLHEQGEYNYEGVERVHANGNKTKWSYKFWSDKIQMNFEKFFWVDVKPTEGEIRPDLINKRGIYKDCYGATQEWTDFQLRCNFPIVMVVAPELFNPQHAWLALEMVEKNLVGPLGMKTLDSSDWGYRGNYDNADDSTDSTVAHGFNYHQGPEWVWPVGYYYRARLYFASKNNKLKETVAEIKYKLSNHFTELQTSDWRGLPELTNADGAYCRDSSRTQAWSMSSILEVLYDLQQIESSNEISS